MLMLLDVLTQLQDLDNRITLIAVLGLVALAGWAILVSWVQRRRGYHPYRKLADHFKTRSRRRSRREQRELAQGRSVVLGHTGWFVLKQPLILPETARCLNVLTLAPTGAGKSVYYLVTFLAADLQHPDVCVVVFDGQHALTESVLALAAAHRREVVIFPDAGFNPLRGPGSAEANAAIFADVFAQVQEARAGSAAEYYTHQAQSFIRKVVSLYERAYGQPMILRELLALCQQETLRARLLADAANTPEAQEFRAFFGGWSAEKFEKSLAGLVNYLDRLCIERGKWLYNQRQAPTLMECVQQGKVVIIREGGAPQTLDHTRGLLYMMLLQEYVRRRKVSESSPLLALYLDEAHYYFNPNYSTFLATSRKNLVAQHLGFQSLEQLRPFTDTITTNCRTWIVHGGLAYQDALVVANNIGQRRFTEQSWSYQRGYTAPRRTYSQRWDLLIQPHEIQGLAQDQALVLTLDGTKREIDAPIFIRKPQALRLPIVPYEEPSVPTTPPPTIWEQREQAHASPTTRQGSSTPASGLPAPTGRTPDW
jgi:hypothetical protein